MSVGQYTKRYNVVKAVTTNDGSGGQVETWSTTVATIWARVRAVSSREQAQAGAVQLLGTYQVLTHYSPAITTERRLVPKGWTGPTLEILGARDPDGSQKDLWLDCAEVI